MYRLLRVLALLLLTLPVFSQQHTKKGAELSDYIKNTLQSKNFILTEQNLCLTGRDTFAYNISHEIPSQKGFDLDFDSSEKKNTVIYSFFQEDFLENEGQIIEFIYHIKQLKLDYNTVFLFTALDKKTLETDSAKTGSQCYADNIVNPLHSLVINIDFFQSTDIISILSGAKYKVSPEWLISRLIAAFNENGTPYKLNHNFLSLYRLGFISGEKRMQSYITANVPSVTISGTSLHIFNALKTFASDYTIQETDQWDSHYQIIKPFVLQKPVLIKEHHLVYAYLFLMTIFLLILCTFSFVGKNSFRKKMQVLNSWYIIPFTLLITFILLVIAQRFIALDFIQNTCTPVVQFGIKIIFTMFFIAILFALQLLLKTPVSHFAYGYIITVVAIINIFVFSAVDLTLFILFSIEYLIVYFARSAKRFASILIFTVILVIPFLPFLLVTITQNTDKTLTGYVQCNTLSNMLLSLILFPFEIMWLRVLLRFNLFTKKIGLNIKYIVKNTALSTLASICVTGAIVFSIPLILRTGENRLITIPDTYIQSDKNINTHLSYSNDNYLGMTTYHLKVKSDKKAIRYIITVFNKDKLNIYDSLYDFNYERDGKSVVFTVPDYPPQNITVDFAMSSQQKASVSITAVYTTDTNAVFDLETVTMSLKGL